MADLSAWTPKSVQALRGYDRATFVADLVSGVTVGFVALPLAMAFSIASGLPPQSGIYCAIVTGFVISLLGGSRCQIGGPTGAFVVVIAGIVAKHGVPGLFMCTMMAGVLLVVMGLTGLGSAVKFIPRPVVVGFTNGIAVLIASTQLRDFLGLRLDAVPGDFTGRIATIAVHLGEASPIAIALAAGAALTIALTRKYAPRISGSVLVLLLGTVLVLVLRLPVETIGSRFGGIPSGLPHFEIPALRLDLVHGLLPSVLTVAMLGAIESLMSAVVADRMSGDRHNPNVELVAQGVANVVSPMFGGLPATGAIARTATNIRTGAKTPVSGMIHALVLLAIILFAAPLASYVPMPILAGILMMTAYGMGEWGQVPELLRLSKAEIAVWLITFSLTVFADLTVAVETGMILATLLFIRNVTATTTVSRVTDDYVRDGFVHTLQDKDIPPYVAIFRIHGPFLFGATDKIAEITERLEALPPIVVVRLRNMTALDATGLLAFQDLAEVLHASGRTLLFCGARDQPRKLMAQARFAEIVGRENICDNVLEALARARAIHEAESVSSTA
ncbi:MAG TPA: SulP family inorganic anion transporter [Candidatus Polarisedimenticolaceae bacterium]|nr:SulP family inorganic anion transporter [Candidatus Polarisedimenticolaceae bacterium]